MSGTPVRGISPDGRWIAYGSRGDLQSTSDLWLADIENNLKSIQLSPAAQSFSWARNGCKLAYLESDDESGTKQETKNFRLILYDPGLVKSISYNLGNLPDTLAIRQFSYSGKYILLTYDKINREYFIFSLETGGIFPVERLPLWINGDRLLWSSANSLIIGDADGTHQREFFSIEGDKFRFAGGGEE
jgi:Tol biopolymer transport system component